MRRRGLMSGGDKPIEFVDAEVKRICVEQWGGKDGGVAATSDRVNNKKVKGIAGEITYKQAAAVKAIREQFKDNTLIEYFDELGYFENLERIGYTGNKSFHGCTNLKHITLPNNLIYLSEGYTYNKGCFYNCTSLTDIYIYQIVLLLVEMLCFVGVQL